LGEQNGTPEIRDESGVKEGEYETEKSTPPKWTPWEGSDAAQKTAGP